MRAYPDPVETLSQPEIKKFFLTLLESRVTAEEKYEALVRFFKIEASLSRELQAEISEVEGTSRWTLEEVLENAVKNVEAWQPDLILETTRESLERALRRIEHSQHQDGGWGYEDHPSHPWATAWTVLCLRRAADLAEDGSLTPPDATAVLIERGTRWLISNRDRWSVYADDIPPDERRSVYETAVALRCLYRTGAAQLPSVRPLVQGCVERLLRTQKLEGDWPATLWGDERPQPPALEVGATSYALQAFAVTGRKDAAVIQAAQRALEWLKRVQNQNPDGSWNCGVYADYTPVPVPSVNKTCDGVKAFLAGRSLGIEREDYRQGMERAVKWLLDQEQALIDEQGKIKGWGWKDATGGLGQAFESRTEDDLLENTCLTLETLLEMESVGLPLLASNALWLVRRQLRDGEDDGKWSNDDTGRIACGILDFYCRTKDSPLFRPAALAAPQPAAAPGDGAAAPEPPGMPAEDGAAVPERPAMWAGDEAAARDGAA